VHEKDENGNAMIGKNIMLMHSKDSLVFSATDRIVIAAGVENLVVVDSGDVVLVLNKDHEQELRKIVNHMRDDYKGKYT
jgi:mannose-1-phosphate guanylyltransferase